MSTRVVYLLEANINSDNQTASQCTALDKQMYHELVLLKPMHPRPTIPPAQAVGYHTIYPGNNMCQKCGRKSGLWVFHEIVNKTYAENMKKIVGAVWELLAKQHSQSSPFPLKLG